LNEVEDQLLELTREQYHVLDAFASPAFPRLVVQGGAGTGKTLLAAECAIREAEHASRRTLFLSFNRLLTAYINRVIRERAVSKKVEVWSVYAFLNQLIMRSKTFGPEFVRRRKDQSDETVYDELYPEYASLAVLEGGHDLYDTLVIDEGQDFISRPLLSVLDGLLVSGIENGRWRVFCDVNNQGAIYGKYDDQAFEYLLRLGHSMVLPVNRRNSKEIAQETTMIAAPRVPSVGITPGIPVEYIWFDAVADQSKRLKNLLYRLYQDGVSAGRITVLTPRSIATSCLSAISDPVLEQVTEQNVYDVVTGSYGATTFSTVSSFKGLENNYIVLVDVENLDGDWWRSVVYVGMSRARAGLCVLVPNKLRSSYESCLRRMLNAIPT
jgi:superfamily I DNA and RNA helicase